MPPYLEHEKLKLVKDKSQAVGEFIQWLEEKGISLAHYPEGSERLCSVYTPVSKLLAEFFEIDLDALEQEKEHMVDSIRRVNTRKKH